MRIQAIPRSSPGKMENRLIRHGLPINLAWLDHGLAEVLIKISFKTPKIILAKVKVII